jgi:hypothetical protein
VRRKNQAIRFLRTPHRIGHIGQKELGLNRRDLSKINVSAAESRSCLFDSEREEIHP